MTGPTEGFPEQPAGDDRAGAPGGPALPVEPPPLDPPGGPSAPLTPADPLWEGPEDREPEPPDPAEVIASAVTAVPGVHELHGGLLGEVGTYLPRRRVRGVRLHPEGCEVHVTVDTSAPIAATVSRIREALGPLVEGRVDIVVQDVAG